MSHSSAFEVPWPPDAEPAFPPTRADAWNSLSNRHRKQVGLLEDLADVVYRAAVILETLLEPAPLAMAPALGTAGWPPEEWREEPARLAVVVGVLRSMAQAERAAADATWLQSLEELRRVT